MWDLSTCDCERNKAWKIDEYLHNKNWSYKNCLFGKTILACDGEILNTTENSLDHKKVTCEKSNCLIHTISLVIICTLLLTVVSIGCFYFYTRQNKNIYCHITTPATNLKKMIIIK